MNRDSKTFSIWQSVDRQIPITHRIDQDLYDVIIVGAGITGLTMGLLLQQAGKNCLILEARNIGFGTTSGTTAHLNTVLDTPYTDIIGNFGEGSARLIAQGAKEAISLIKGNIDRLQIKCDFQYRDGYLFAEDDTQIKELEDIYNALGKVGIEAAYTNQIPIPIPFLKAIKFSGQAQFHPTEYILALAKAFQQKGGTIKEGERVEKADMHDETHLVRSTSTVHRARAVVHATHIPFGINYLHFKTAPYRSYLMGVRLRNGNYPESLAYDMQDPYHYFRTVNMDGEKILLVGGCDHKTGHGENTDYIFKELEAYIRTHYQVSEICYNWSAQYYEPVDGLPFIGELPGGSDGTYVATGYSGNGMIFGTLAAKIISDMIMNVQNQYVQILSPKRLKPIASFKNFVKENFDVAKHFVKDRLGAEELKSLSELATEEGRLVKYQEQQIAIYKDAAGALTALHPVCPHAGCIVQWNSAEKSWDCPCHGARYDTKGELLNGPATESLKKISLE